MTNEQNTEQRTKRIGCLITPAENARMKSVESKTLSEATLIRAALEAFVPGLFPEYKNIPAPKLRK